MRPIKASTANPRYAFAALSRSAPGSARLGLRVRSSCRWVGAPGPRTLGTSISVDGIPNDLVAAPGTVPDELQCLVRLKFLRQAEERNIRRYGTRLTADELRATVRRFQS